MRLTCSVRDVFPADHFRIVWMDGERELASESGPFSSRLQNLTLVLSYRVEAKDDDKVIACDVLLDMDGVPAAQARRASLTTLSLHCKSIWISSTFSPLMQYATNRATGTRLKQCFLIVNLRNYFKGFSKHSFFRSSQRDKDYREPAGRFEGRRICEHFMSLRQRPGGPCGAEEGDGRYGNRAEGQ